MFTATYPKTNDTGDTDNTGDAVDSLCWYYEPNVTTSSTGAQIIFYCEFEYDDVY